MWDGGEGPGLGSANSLFRGTSAFIIVIRDHLLRTRSDAALASGSFHRPSSPLSRTVGGAIPDKKNAPKNDCVVILVHGLH